MSSRWTHAACEPCFFIRYPGNPNPHRINEQYRQTESCCYCATPTQSGLYDRNDPQQTPCLGRNGTTHREDGPG